jgi:lysyl endopeptidase
MKRIILILYFFLSGAGAYLSAQISEGGIPRKFPALKMAVVPVVKMPYINNEMLRWNSERENERDKLLKPFTFAFPFEVNITPANEGTWGRSGDGWWLWQLTVSSEGAYSLNLLLENVHLPPQARLYLFTPDQSEILGAFTAATISDSRIFTTAPLPGDKIVLQYEIPGTPGENPDFTITRINHDFIGILKYTDARKPMGVSAGECNKDIHCQVGDRWKDVANSVCRVMVLGKDLCTGTLLNNTALNKKPYIITANHCINSALKASGTLFLFNYESPYCGSLDGDITNSMSGSKLKATLDSLDFTLVEMNTPPPPSLRPFFAGWSRNTTLPDSVASIHHPQGDIKKISIDNEHPVIATFLTSFAKNAYWKILKWDAGTTEIGSSGGPCFNKDQQLIGTLSGGAADCPNPVNDYFARFDLAWNYKPDSARQLKYWLDPSGSNPLTFNGKQFNSGDQLCRTFTNLKEGDKHTLVKSANTAGGFWSGTNKDGITEIADKFSIAGKEKISGISIGIGRKVQTNVSNNSYVTLKVYNLNGKTPVLLAVKDTILLKNLASDAMNYIKFNNVVEPSDSFLIAINFDNVKPGDSLAIYQTIRSPSSANSFWLKKNNAWTPFNEISPSFSSGSLAFEVLACNTGGTTTDTVYIKQTIPALVWPNPAVGSFHVQTSEDIREDRIFVYNLNGQLIHCNVARSYPRRFEVNMAGNPSGIYFLRVEIGDKQYRAKVLLVSQGQK